MIATSAWTLVFSHFGVGWQFLAFAFHTFSQGLHSDLCAGHNSGTLMTFPFLQRGLSRLKNLYFYVDLCI
nr:MAG TPA: hypothetical protein [Bacteriophage sp.]